LSAVRLDKFLKVSRIVKRRSFAQQLCNGGHVTKNGRTAKPSTRIDVGDIITINYGTRMLSFRVIAITEKADKKNPGVLYEELSLDGAKGNST